MFGNMRRIACAPLALADVLFDIKAVRTEPLIGVQRNYSLIAVAVATARVRQVIRVVTVRPPKLVMLIKHGLHLFRRVLVAALRAPFVTTHERNGFRAVLVDAVQRQDWRSEATGHAPAHANPDRFAHLKRLEPA